MQIPEGISRKILRAERHADADLLHAQQVDEAAVLPGLALDLPGLVVALSRSCVSIARSRVALTDAAGWVMGGEGTADGGEKTWQLVTFQDHGAATCTQAQQGLLSPPSPLSTLSWLWFRLIRSHVSSKTTCSRELLETAWVWVPF